MNNTTLSKVGVKIIAVKTKKKCDHGIKNLGKESLRQPEVAHRIL